MEVFAYKKAASLSDIARATPQPNSQNKRNVTLLLKGKNLQIRIFYPARLSYRIEEEIKSFPNKN